MAEYKLTYFASKGRAEHIRLLFTLAEVAFEDVKIPVGANHPVDMRIPPEIQQKLPFNQVPILEFGNTILSQSGTIGRFLARKFNLMGDSDLEAAKIDEITDGIGDYASSFVALRHAKDEASKKEAFQTILTVATPKYLGKFNEILLANGGQFMVGKRVSYADLSMYYILTYLSETTKMDLVKNYAGLSGLVERFGSIPQIKKYNESQA